MSESRWLRIVLVILMLFLVVWLVDIQHTWSILKGTDFRWIGLGFLVVQLQVILSAYRWRQTAYRLGLKLTVRRTIAEYYLGTLANLSLPGGVGGDAARVYRNRDSRGWEPAIKSVTLERLAGQIALLLVTLTGWMLWPVLLEEQAPASLQHVFMLLASVCLSLAALTLLFGRLSARFHSLVKNVGQAMRRVWFSDAQWFWQLSLSLGIVASYIAVFAISAKALSVVIPVIALVTIVPVILLSMILPLSIGGWGVRELAAATLLPVVGLSAEAGIATSVVYGLVSMLSVVPGALFFVLFKPATELGANDSSECR